MKCLGCEVKNGLPYYKAYPRDFMEGTIGMPFELKGAYRLLLDLIYMQAGRLLDDPKYISGHLGCSVRAWGNYRAALVKLGKIQADGKFISNFRATLEIDKLEIISDKQRENASQPRKNNRLPKAMDEPKPSHTEPEPDKKKREAIASPKEAVRGSRLASDWTLPSDWLDWSVKAGLSEPDIRREAERFRDYWISKPGREAVKVDWQATWRNWMRKRIDDAKPRPVPQQDFWTGKALA